MFLLCFAIIKLTSACCCYIFESIIKTKAMEAAEIENFINVYSMIRFSDGHREPGILMNKYNIEESCISYFFIAHNSMNDYKKAHDIANHSKCDQLSLPIDLAEVVSISPINLSDYKAILELHAEYKQPRMLNG